MFKSLPLSLCLSGVLLLASGCSSTSNKGNSSSDGGPTSSGGTSSGDGGVHVNHGGSGSGGSGHSGASNGGTSSGDASTQVGSDASLGADSGSDASVTPGGPVAAIPLATNLDTSGAADDEAALLQLVGEYDVAIFFAKAGNEGDIGAGKIKIAYDGDIIRLTLKGAGGATLAEVANSRMNPVDYGQATFTRVIGMILVDQRDLEYMRIDVSLSPDGSVSGYVGGNGEYYHFRNNVIHYGPTPPPQLLAQAGTWSGPSLALTCGQPPVTVDVTANGGVTISGKGNLDCMDHEVQKQWDGMDDYVEPKLNMADRVQIVIDSAGGGMKLTAAADPEMVGLYNALTVLGAEGNLEVENPTKQ